MFERLAEYSSTNVQLWPAFRFWENLIAICSLGLYSRTDTSLASSSPSWKKERSMNKNKKVNHFNSLSVQELKKRILWKDKNLDSQCMFSLKSHLEGSFGNVEVGTMQDNDFGFMKHEHVYGSVTSEGHIVKIRVQSQVITQRLYAAR